MLDQYNLSKDENHNEAAKNSLMYHYMWGNLGNYIFSSKMNLKTSSPVTSKMQILRKFEKSMTRELFLRRNKQMARKIIREIKIEHKRKKSGSMLFIVGAGM